MTPPRDRVPLGGGAPLGTSLADALAARGVGVVRPSPASPPAAPPAPDGDLARCGKVVLRRERKGRGGKTTTVIAGLGLSARALEALARDVRHALGCGAVVEGDTIVVQGDLAPRLEPFLTARGARRVVLGN